MSGARTWHGWAVPLPGGGVCVDREAAAFVLFLLRQYVSTFGPQNGGPTDAGLSPMAREVRTACEVSTRGMSADGQMLRTFDADPPSSPSRPDDLLTMDQVAEELHVTDRHARRLADGDELGFVTYAGRSKLVRRVEVDAYKNRPRSHR